jgi:hypothetical protein
VGLQAPAVRRRHFKDVDRAAFAGEAASPKAEDDLRRLPRCWVVPVKVIVDRNLLR